MATPAGLEPATHSLEGCCSNPLSYEAIVLVRLVGLEPTWLTPTDFKSVVYTDSTTVAKIGRTCKTRTCDPLLPKQVLYQTELISEVVKLVYPN